MWSFLLHPIRSLNSYFDRQEADERRRVSERGWSARQIAAQMSRDDGKRG